MTNRNYDNCMLDTIWMASNKDPGASVKLSTAIKRIWIVGNYLGRYQVGKVGTIPPQLPSLP